VLDIIVVVPLANGTLTGNVPLPSIAGTVIIWIAPSIVIVVVALLAPKFLSCINKVIIFIGRFPNAQNTLHMLPRPNFIETQDCQLVWHHNVVMP
jgi:hypothetical protein